MRFILIIAAAAGLGIGSGTAADGPGQRPLYPCIDVAFLTHNKLVKTELKITKDQESGIKASLDKWREKQIPDSDAERKITGPDKDERIRALNTKRSEELFQSLALVLRPEQVKRLKQIMLQQMGIGIFKHPEIRKALDLNDEKVKALKAASEKLRKDLVAEVEAKRITQQEAINRDQAQSNGVPEKVQALLTDVQRKTLKDLLGEPFKFD